VYYCQGTCEVVDHFEKEDESSIEHMVVVVAFWTGMVLGAKVWRL